MKNKIGILVAFSLSMLTASEAGAAVRKGALGILDHADGALAEVIAPDNGAFLTKVEQPLSDLEDRLRFTRTIVAEMSPGAKLAPKPGRQADLIAQKNY